MQKGVTYNIGFWYTYSGLSGVGDTNLILKRLLANDTTESVSENLIGQVLDVKTKNKPWTHFTYKYTAAEDGYYVLFYEGRARHESFIVDEFTCYAEGHEPESKDKTYWNANDLASLVAEDESATMVDGKATYTKAQAAAGITIEYSEVGDVYTNTFVTDLDGAHTIKVRFTNANGLQKIKEATFTVYSDKIPATVNFSANETTIKTIEDVFVGDEIEMIGLTEDQIPEGYRFDGWKIGDATLAVGAKFTLVDPATTATAILTKLVYGELLDKLNGENKSGYYDQQLLTFDEKTISIVNDGTVGWPHGHVHYSVNLQKGVTYQLSLVANGTMTVSAAGGCNFQFWIAKGSSNEQNANQVSETLEIVAQGKTETYEDKLFKMTYTCTEDGVYTVSFRTWSISAGSNMTITDLSLKGIDPNELDYSERLPADWYNLSNWNPQYIPNEITVSDKSWQFNWAEVSANVHASTKVALQKGVTYVLSLNINGTVTAADLGMCLMAFGITTGGTGGSGMINRVSDEMLITGQGQTTPYNNETKQITYTCEESGDYYVSMWAWGISNCTFTISNLSLKGVDPNAEPEQPEVTDPLNETFASDAALATVTTNHAGNATYTFDADNTATDDGTGSLKIVGASHSDDPNRDDYFDKADAYFAVTLESGKTYTLTFDYRADNLQEISGAIHFVKVLKPSEGKDGEEKDGYKDDVTYASSSGLPKLDWSNLTSGDWNHFDGFTFTATESGTHYIYFRLWQLAGEVRLDNIKVVEVKA